MTRAFDIALRALFADQNMACNATYQPSNGVPFVVRTIFRASDRVIDLSDTAALLSDTIECEVFVADVPRPKIGDVIRFDESRYVVASEPRRGDTGEGLVWRLKLARHN